MTLELSPELESQIERAAQLRGTDAQSFALETLRAAAQSATEQEASTKSITKEERRAVLDRLQGSMKNSTTTVDDFLAERREEARHEANR